MGMEYSYLDDGLDFDATTFAASDSRITYHSTVSLLEPLPRDVLDPHPASHAGHEEESRFRDVVHDLPAIVWECDPQTWTFTFASNHAATLLGYSVSQWLNDSEFWETLYHPDDSHWVKGVCRESLTHEQERTFECRVRSVDGDVRWFFCTVQRVECLHHAECLHHNGVRLRCLMVDVTQRKQEDELNRRLVDRHEDLLACLAHQLRTPLVSMKGFLELLRHGKVEDPLIQHEFLNRAADNVTTLCALVDGLRDVSQWDDGPVELGREICAVNDLVSRALDVVQWLAVEKGMALCHQSAAPLLSVNVDRQWVSQVLINVLENAIKFSGAGSTVVIASDAVESGVMISIRDQGPGILPESLSHIFDKRFQAESDMKRAGIGSGIGLYLAKRVVDAHGGRITVESIVGVGSIFSIFLPGPQPELLECGAAV